MRKCILIAIITLMAHVLFGQSIESDGLTVELKKYSETETEFATLGKQSIIVGVFSVLKENKTMVTYSYVAPIIKGRVSHVTVLERSGEKILPRVHYLEEEKSFTYNEGTENEGKEKALKSDSTQEIVLSGLMVWAKLKYSKELTPDEKFKVLVNQGVTLTDEGKYEEAVARYLEALTIDKNSVLVNYELSATYMYMGNYKGAIKYSRKVIDQHQEYEELAYVVLGSSLDLSGSPRKAIKAYEKGLVQFSGSNLLNYNLGLTAYNSNDYETAEKAAINAILAKPDHGSSHILLSAIMNAKGYKIKSILPLYYFLMIEPNSDRSAIQYQLLLKKLASNVVKKDEKNINIIMPSLNSGDPSLRTTELILSLNSAARFTTENKDKTDLEYFAETTQLLFGNLIEHKDKINGFWWDFYITTFNSLVETENVEAFCYYIAQTSENEEVKEFITNNPDKISKLEAWFKD